MECLPQDVDRTLMNAFLVLTGMSKEETNETGGKQLHENMVINKLKSTVAI